MPSLFMLTPVTVLSLYDALAFCLPSVYTLGCDDSLQEESEGTPRHWLHIVPKRIVCTIGSETSTTTRHRNANIPSARWRRRARSYNSLTMCFLSKGL